MGFGRKKIQAILVIVEGNRSAIGLAPLMNGLGFFEKKLMVSVKPGHRNQ
jgi:hypothetical protein